MSLWLKFLRQYGPIARNDNMYDETIQRTARRTKIRPLEFKHPHHDILLNIVKDQTSTPCSVILTGTAGDGKTHLCRQVWEELGGNAAEWADNSTYLLLQINTRKIHFIRDLSAWVPQQDQEWPLEKNVLLDKMCKGFFETIGNEAFIIAANDGQLVESLRRLPTTNDVIKARQVIEDLLVDDQQEMPGIKLKMLNLSRSSSTILFDRAIAAFLNHSEWRKLSETPSAENDFWGTQCPIRHNYELLKTPLVQSRLRILLELCDHNGLHVPIRQILLLLTNALLGHPDVKDHLMISVDVPKVIADRTVSKASLYNNIFGGNLPEPRRQAITIFDYLSRFQIGHETSNRVDNILIFGQDDPELEEYFRPLIESDKFYGADERYYAAKREYIEGTSENEERDNEFLQMLIAQRRGLFFKIPKEMETELKLWELTVFRFAGEYTHDVVEVIKHDLTVKRPILSRLIKGLNRVFTGMLINSDRELYLATSGNYSQAKVSRILIDRVSVVPGKGEKVILQKNPDNGHVMLSVFFSPDNFVDFNLTLIRYEFLSRIAFEGALPASFSKECYEDLLALKSQLIATYAKRQAKEEVQACSTISLTLLSLTEQGTPDPKNIEIIP